ncbi:MAG: response regulator transcription factor [Planctomycetaceae bacterium]|nr:response regulator transcription factor [Planctomycetaceae bacterium]MBQ2820636.1 response regulator transcription factor [Thermoguttaceae bacterium]
MNSETEKKPHILVVEDEINLAVGIRYSLEHENFLVTLIHDGLSALDLILKNPHKFDVIVLDIMLPGMNGYSICSEIREKGILIPIMFLSARTLPEDKARGFDVGANQYLPKPFELEEFLARIRNMLKFKTLLHDEKKSNEKNASDELPYEMRIGNATVNFNTLEAKNDQKTIHLTHLEISLLKYFILNENRLISKEELLENVWKMSSGMNTRAPDQFILRLRKIFEKDPAHPELFLTYRNAGYRFTAQTKSEYENIHN